MPNTSLQGIFTDDDRRTWSRNRRAASAAITSSARLQLPPPRRRRIGLIMAVVCAALIVAGSAWRAHRWSPVPEDANAAPLRPSPVQPAGVPVLSINAVSPPIRPTPARSVLTDLPKEQDQEHQRPARERSFRQVTPRKGLPPAATTCLEMHGAARARCLHPVVLAADAALRRAYADAEAAGVPRATLAPVRDRWAEVNSRFSDDPDYMIANLRSLAKGVRGLRRADRQAR